MPVTAAPRRRLAILLAACLAAALGGLVTTAATAAPSGPVSISIDGVTGQTLTGLGNLPPGAKPEIFVQAGQTFTVQVSFHDATGATVPFNTDMTLAISGTTNSGAAALTPSTVIVPKGMRPIRSRRASLTPPTR